MSSKEPADLPKLSTLDDTAGYIFGEIAKSITVKTDPLADKPDIIEWILRRKLKTERGRPFEFINHFFMVPVMRDWSQEQVSRKGAQIGMSSEVTLKEFYAAEYFGWNTIHTFPTLRMVQKFVPVKVDGLLDANPDLKQHIGKGTANSQQKKRYDLCWVFWAGCEGDNEGIMDTADLIANDEVDRSDPLTVQDFMSRLSASEYKGRWDFSNPTTDGAMVSKRWKESDQKHLFHRCSRCGVKFTNGFFNCVDLDNPEREYICPRCHKPLRHEDRLYDPETKYPRWVAKHPGREISGYWINQMIAPWISAKETITGYLEGTDEYFHKFVLAKPVADSESKVSREVILRNCTNAVPERKGVLLGIDQGKTFYAVIGNDRGFFALETGLSWSDMDKLMASYDVQTCVVDYLPDTDGAVEFSRRWPGKVLFNLQTREMKTTDVFRFDELKGFVYTDKHPMITKVLKAFIRGDIAVFMDPSDSKLVGRSLKDYSSYCGQAETLYRMEVPTREGNYKLEWNSTNKMDHWFLATCYYYAARERLKMDEEIHDVEQIKREELERDPTGVTAFEPAEDAWMYV